jgi:septal ring factor EnvC (AmiA/AmiB activator)
MKQQWLRPTDRRISMRRTRATATLTLLLSLTLLIPFALAEEDIDQSQVEAKLKELESEISRYREMLDSTQGQKSDIEQTLERNEKSISDLINKIEDIEEELSNNQDKVSKLTRQQKELLGAKKEQQHYIELQVRAAYEIGHQEYMKLLLNQEDPDEIARMLTFYEYFNEARAEQIQSYNSVLADLDRVSLALATELEQLNANQSALNTEKTELAITQAHKKKALRELIGQIRTAGTEISRLEQDRSRLEELLSRLEQRLANLPIAEQAEPFEKMQGKLYLPVSGRISHRFGNKRNQGKLRWDGVFIDAGEGDPVHAVHYGRVVFSDWLRGFGLLLIISHGEGYMSLYGHNQALYRETGDWVSAGEVIATVGDSGGQNRTGLYFEIRIAGKPSDPQKWCVARQQGAA